MSWKHHKYRCCISMQWLQCDPQYGLPDSWCFTLSGITRGYDFSINNAPLIIVLLFKGEWQSFPSSRGVGVLCASTEGLIYILKSAPRPRGNLSIIFCQYSQWTFFVVENSPILWVFYGCLTSLSSIYPSAKKNSLLVEFHFLKKSNI